MNYIALNFDEKLGLFDEHWAPQVIAEMNDYQDGELTAANDVWI